MAEVAAEGEEGAKGKWEGADACRAIRFTLARRLHASAKDPKRQQEGWRKATEIEEARLAGMRPTGAADEREEAEIAVICMRRVHALLVR